MDLSLVTIDEYPGEKILSNCLQKNLEFWIGNKIIRRGKLLLYKPVNFSWILTLTTNKNGSIRETENLELPMPFHTEDHLSEGLFYFDYRLINIPVVYNPAPAYTFYQHKPLGDRKNQFFDSILETKVLT